ncbi:CaiB/BaiF CoA-transferase family protein [Celeribacter sp. PS-C1]|uniref:CaiB/BaiF CoA transferase family protein n=1 Tax=Celeribacter sp. PS-C1 TaxID=2820813 RepID=UPI001C685818|nr:CaiB/BaiF CoA-transferase family protein [Celeribacter sp. PS-C1]MBW6419797.1 CoA transferase [Celeribacter sp. PS-C1]
MGALANIKVLELAGMGPTPFCGMLLADMGADVLRIDRLKPTGDGIVMQAAADLRGRNKRTACIDLKNPEGKEALLELVKSADILIEGYRPGVTERMGIGPEVCLHLNPALVYGRATGWGREGPLAMTAGHDINYLALTGALTMIGPPGGAPVPPLNLVGDLGGGALYLAFGVLCALNSARSTGRGQVVDAAMIDGIASLLTVSHGRRQFGQYVPERGQNILDGGAPFYCTYKTADAKYMAVGAIEARFYHPFVQHLDLTDLPDRQDRKNWPELRTLFADRFAQKSRAEWEAIFENADACVSPVLDLEEAGTHPHNQMRRMLVEQEGVENPAPAPRLSETPGTLRRAPVLPGSDTEEALRDWGLTPDKIRKGFEDGYFTAPH